MAEGTTQIRFSRSLYRQDAIESAITAYGALATLSLEVGPSDFRVQVSDIDERVVDRLEDAFCNHCLFETARLERHVEGL